MSWGTKITILYIGFVILIVSMVYISVNNKSELVSKNYYEQELVYQDRIDAVNNEKKLAVTINYEIVDQFIVLGYLPNEIKKDFKGEVLFFRPSDSTKDLTIDLKFDQEGEQIISKDKLSKGVYKMCISWKNDKKTFYKEAIITI
ncbi:MAG: FixH family protein [Bacteroidota bacterium]|nr:FixH family protein [Bacteroidota bacterium]